MLVRPESARPLPRDGHRARGRPRISLARREHHLVQAAALCFRGESERARSTRCVRSAGAPRRQRRAARRRCGKGDLVGIDRRVGRLTDLRLDDERPRCLRGLDIVAAQVHTDRVETCRLLGVVRLATHRLVEAERSADLARDGEGGGRLVLGLLGCALRGARRCENECKRQGGTTGQERARGHAQMMHHWGCLDPLLSFVNSASG